MLLIVLYLGIIEKTGRSGTNAEEAFSNASPVAQERASSASMPSLFGLSISSSAHRLDFVWLSVIMAETLPYLVELGEAAVVVRFDRDFFDNNDLTDLLDFLRLKVIRKRSQLTDEQIATLAAEIK